VLRGHDASDEHIDPDARALSTPLWQRRAGDELPSRFLEEVPSQLIEIWRTQSGVDACLRRRLRCRATPRALPHERLRRTTLQLRDESQEAFNPSAGGRKASGSKPFVASWMKPKVAPIGNDPTKE